MPARLLLDTCVTINLVATGELEALARANETKFVMVRQAAEETMTLRGVVEGQRVSIPVDLTPHLRSGTMEITELSIAETPSYVNHACIVDDGEAATIAVAQSRGLLVATDDRAARRLCGELDLSQPVGTAGLVRTYAEKENLASTQIRALLLRIEELACFVPARSDPDSEWWQDHMRR